MGKAKVTQFFKHSSNNKDYKSAQGDEDAGVQCSEWLASSRKHCLSSDVIRN